MPSNFNSVNITNWLWLCCCLKHDRKSTKLLDSQDINILLSSLLMGKKMQATCIEQSFTITHYQRYWLYNYASLFLIIFSLVFATKNMTSALFLTSDLVPFRNYYFYALALTTTNCVKSFKAF